MGDAINALMLYDNGDRVFGCGDWAWLSLMPGSPTLGILGATEGDVLFVDGCNLNAISIEYTADQLGLASFVANPGWAPDDVDALKGEIACLTGPDSDAAIGNGTGIPGDDGTVPNGDVPAANDCADTDDDNDGYPDNLELLLPDPSCPAKTALTSPGGDITYDDNANGNPCVPLGTDAADDGPSWDSDGDGVLDGAECTLGTDPANPLSCRAWRPAAARATPTATASRTPGRPASGAPTPMLWTPTMTVLGDCIEAVDTDGNGIVNYGGDALNSARAALLPAAARSARMETSTSTATTSLSVTSGPTL